MYPAGAIDSGMFVLASPVGRRVPVMIDRRPCKDRVGTSDSLHLLIHRRIELAPIPFAFYQVRRLVQYTFILHRERTVGESMKPSCDGSLRLEDLPSHRQPAPNPFTI